MNRVLYLVGAICLLPILIYGHGSMEDPISRVYSIYLENPESPKSEAGKAAVAVNGTQPFYDWHEVSRNIPDYNWQAVIPDGQLASAGRAKYAGLDLVRSDWPATLVEAGPYRFVYHAHVPHDPSFFRAYITKAGWDPNTPLAWADLEILPGAENAVGQGNYYTWDTVLPEREGRHVIYVVWQRIDPVGEVFFSVSDVVFGEDNGTGGAPVNPGGGQPGGDHGGHHGGGSDHGNSTIEADLAVASSWYNGFSANVTIKNTGVTPVNGWTLEFDYPHNIVNHWSAVLVSRSGHRYIFRNESWNGAIPTGGQVTFGIQGEGDASGVLQNVVFNGSALGGQPGSGDDHGGGDNGGGHDHGGGNDHEDPGDNPGNPDPEPEPVVSTFTASFAVASDWGNGFTADITVTNQGDPVSNGWTLEFDFGRVISSIWNAEVVSRNGTRYVIRNAPWNGSLASGASVSFGFSAAPGNLNGEQPIHWVFNGVSAGGTGSPEHPGHGDDPGSGDNGEGENPGHHDVEDPGDHGGNDDPGHGDTGGGDHGGGTETPAPTGEKRIVAYFPSWGIYQKGYEVEHLPAAKLTHVIHAFARISAAGEIEIIDPWADIERPVGPDSWDTPLRGHFGAYARLKATHPHLRVLIAVGGWFDSGRFSDVAASSAARSKFAQSVRNFCVQYGFDGVDLDWEYPVVATDVNSNVRPSDGENYALLAKAIREAFDAQEAIDGKHYEISAATPAGFDKFERINLATLAAQLDFVNLMTYDFHGRWVANQTGHNAPLYRSAGDPNARYNTDEAIRGYLAAGVPAHKLLLGIPAYGYGWQGVGNGTPFSSASGVGPGTLTIEPGFYDYRTVADLVRANPAAERWDEQAQSSYYYDGNLWISYDSPRAVRRKLDYAEAKGLGGVMFWEASTDIRNTNDSDSLISIVYQELR